MQGSMEMKDRKPTKQLWAEKNLFTKSAKKDPKIDKKIAGMEARFARLRKKLNLIQEQLLNLREQLDAENEPSENGKDNFSDDQFWTA